MQYSEHGNEIRRDARKFAREASRLGDKVDYEAMAEHAMRMSAHQVVVLRIQIGCLDQLNLEERTRNANELSTLFSHNATYGKVVGKVVPRTQVPHGVDPTRHLVPSSPLNVSIFFARSPNASVI